MFVAVYNYDLKNLIEQLKKAKYMENLERQELESQRQTYRTIKHDQARANAPSDLAIRFQQKLLDYEQNLVTNAHSTFVENELEEEVVDVNQLEEGEAEDDEGEGDASEGSELGQAPEDDEGVMPPGELD